MSQADQLVWQRRCPSLEHITWIQRNHIMQMESFGLLWNEQGRELKSLDISCGITHDQHLSVIFTQLPFLEKLVAQDSEFGPISLTALLTNLRDKIQVLDLAGCKAVTPEMVNLIMESCPSLKSLSADRLRAADGDDSGGSGGGGGVFTGPTLLPPNEAQFATYSKIATLKKLRVLNLGRYTSSTPPPKSILDLSLAGGFQQLESLKELRVFDFCHLDHKMTMEEFKFMLKAWPKLETIHGKLSSGGTRASFIESYLKNKRPWLRVKSSMGFNRRATRTEY
ncbi:hypothetical protein BGZ80_000355 [Entomortierella chlamydospora]|uniref:F-box domain protein n=1 Tax=Entomortierella chlamydospora TaxID=101097 RepID=A0A9P6SYH9_9FUNG|nr:hypothetical protein BGZ80_000355 [Entomortierella chlamydospora]